MSDLIPEPPENIHRAAAKIDDAAVRGWRVLERDDSNPSRWWGIDEDGVWTYMGWAEWAKVTDALEWTVPTGYATTVESDVRRRISLSINSRIDMWEKALTREGLTAQDAAHIRGLIDEAQAIWDAVNPGARTPDTNDTTEEPS